MAALRKEIIVFTIIFCFQYILFDQVSSVRTKKKIYIDLKTQSACFRNLNATHEVGCTSDSGGNVGTVHYVESDEDLDWILSKGPHSPYVALLNAVDFTNNNVGRLYRSSRVNGIMVINIETNSTSTPFYPPNGFSSVDSCPDDRYGLYSNNSEYKNCKQMPWNPPGTGLHFQDIGIPVFALSDEEDVDAVLNKCFYKFNSRKNNETRTYPVCAAEMKARMDAAVDSVTCMRRSQRFTLSLSSPQQYCDPLGDKNVITTMKAIPQNETRKEGSVIVLGARVDSTSLFQNEYQAADTSVAGIVTLLATAEALWKVKDDIRSDDAAKDIMFAFFQGESFDYIGSSRMVYDMNRDKFPQKYSKDDKTLYLQHINLTHLDQFIELNQVGHRDQGKLWVHTDPTNRQQSKSDIFRMIDDLAAFGRPLDVKLEEANEKLPLPPASTQQFLKHRPNIPVVVITDHQKDFSNKYYNSRFDRPELINATDYPADMNESQKYDYVTYQAQLIANLSTTLARYLYKASTGKNVTGINEALLTSDPLTITHLLYCFLISPNCELFIESVDADNVKSLTDAKQPFPFYVSVDSHIQEVTQLIHSIMARFTGEKTVNSENLCNAPDPDKRYSYVWMQGNLTEKDGKKTREGWCMKAVVHYTDAVSPAFHIDGYDMRNGEYSTWTESVWGSRAIGVRLFLLPSQEFQASVLVVGILLFLVSLVVVYFIQSRSTIIFNTSSSNSGQLYNPMT